MSILFFMIPVSLALGICFVAAFVWSVGDGQLDDTETPAHRILED
jgi:cbb3-type cytochrome oxidase maturation protein